MPPSRKTYGGTSAGQALRIAGLIGALLALSGCVVVPAYYPRYAYHPYRYYYPYYRW
jgi:hypothetical protein